MSPAGRTFDNTGLLGYLAEVDAELVANDVAGILDRGLDL